MKNHLLVTVTITTLAIAQWGSSAFASGAANKVSAEQAYSRLRAGNQRFASQKSIGSKPTAARRAATAKSQAPFAVIVACADSRVAPELVFDQNLGDLFVIRTAGNLVDDYALGSVEYAVEHLGTRLIVVMGHERCGAVAAAAQSGSAPGHVGALVRDIRPAAVAAQSMEGDVMENAVKINAANTAAKVRRDKMLRDYKDLQIMKAYYDLDSGRVTFFR